VKSAPRAHNQNGITSTKSVLTSMRRAGVRDGAKWTITIETATTLREVDPFICKCGARRVFQTAAAQLCALLRDAALSARATTMQLCSPQADRQGYWRRAGKRAFEPSMSAVYERHRLAVAVLCW